MQALVGTVMRYDRMAESCLLVDSLSTLSPSVVTAAVDIDAAQELEAPALHLKMRPG
jgi:hypothetical protein